MATILGITGPIGSGKSTFSELLAMAEPHSVIYESGEVIIEIAEQFNKALASELSFEVADNDVDVINQALIWLTGVISEQLHKDIVWSQLALTKHRRAVHPEYYEKLFAYLKQLRAHPALANQHITKDNKATYRPLLQWLGGYLVATVSKTVWFDEIFRRIDRYDAGKKLIIINGLRYPTDAELVRSHSGFILTIERPTIQALADDITEASRSKITADSLILNNGTLDDLTQLARRVWDEASISRLQKLYKAV